MSALRWVLIVVGIFMMLVGTVFALQGDNMVGGSSLMDGNSMYIYIGGVVAVIGLLLVAGGIVAGRSRGKIVSPPPVQSGSR